MGELTLWRARERLTRELVGWQAGAIGLLVLAVAGNMALAARIGSLEQAREADAVRYRAQIERVEQTRDRAVEQLGALVLQAEAEQQAREAQAMAYEALEGYRYIGECVVTYYCPCEQCCGKWADGLTATGIPASPGIVAVDPGVIPLGSTVIIDGQKYLAADTGVTGKHVDVCLADHAATVEAGVGNAEVWVVCEE